MPRTFSGQRLVGSGGVSLDDVDYDCVSVDKTSRSRNSSQAYHAHNSSGAVWGGTGDGGNVSSGAARWGGSGMVGWCRRATQRYFSFSNSTVEPDDPEKIAVLSTKRLIVYCNILSISFGLLSICGGLYLSSVCYGYANGGTLFTGAKCLTTQRVGGPVGIVLGVCCSSLGLYLLCTGVRFKEK